MQEVTLLEKLDDRKMLKRFKMYLTQLFGTLNIELTQIDMTTNGWIRVLISGEDLKVALSLLNREFGIAPSARESLRKGMSLLGKFVGNKQDGECCQVDVGIILPKADYMTIELTTLRAQLADGRRLPYEKITQLYGLTDGSTIEVQVSSLDTGIRGQLTEGQLEKYRRWINSRFDYLKILGVPIERVRAALRKVKSQRAVLGVESLGFLEQLVTCKIGTDASGLIPLLGRYLIGGRFSVVSPRRILTEIGNHWQTSVCES